MLKRVVFTNVTVLFPTADLIECIKKYYEICALFLLIFMMSKTVQSAWQLMYVLFISKVLGPIYCDTDKENNHISGKELVLRLV
jgi:hypothetical protein